MARVNSNPVGTFAAKSRKPGWNFYKKRAKIQKRNEAAWNCLPGKEENDVRRKKGNCGDHHCKAKKRPDRHSRAGMAAGLYKICKSQEKLKTCQLRKRTSHLAVLFCGYKSKAAAAGKGKK